MYVYSQIKQAFIAAVDKITMYSISFSGEVIKEGDIKCIMGEGMPQYRNPFDKGRLVISFTVNFPADNWVPGDQIANLEKFLPPRQEVIIPDEAEECVLHKFDPRHQSQGQRQAYEEDDEEGHGPRVQCASQ